MSKKKLHLTKLFEMKLRGIIVSDVRPATDIIVVKFTKDPKEQKFEVRCTFKPYEHRIRKYSICLFWIKWESETVFAEEGIRYHTHLICDKAIEEKEKRRRD